MNEERGKAMNTKKVMSIVTAASMLVLSVSGCSLLGGKDRQAIEDAATGYIDAVNAGKFNKSLKFVEDEEDFFQENEIPSDQAELVAAVMGASEITVENIEAKKDKGSADIVFTMPDLDEIADEGYSLDEFIDAIEDIEGETEETVEFSFVKDGEDWLIEADSTEEYYNFLMSIGEGIEFSGLSEAGAIEAVNTFIGLLAEGDIETAITMSPVDDETLSGLDELEEEFGSLDPLRALFISYFSNLDYELTVSEVTEDSIIVDVTGMAPDAEPAVNAAVNDVDIMAPIAADYIESTLNNSFDMSLLMNQLFGVVADAVSNADLIPYSSQVTVTVDEEGNYLVDPAEDFGFDYGFPDIMGSDEVFPAALDLLLEEGRITPSQYAELTGEPLVTNGDYDVTDVIVEEGDDFYDYSYAVNDDAVTVTVRTWDYYNTGDVFAWEATYNGSDLYSGEYTMTQNSCDTMQIILPVVTGDPTGTYELTVYDEGEGTSTVLVVLEIIVLGDGAPAGPVGTGVSMTFDNAGADFYSFHFTDANGNNMDDQDTYPSNAGTVDFVVRTWDYYDSGAQMTCEVLRDGEQIDEITSVNDQDFNDTFYFSYEPSRLEDGDYTFVISDVDADTTLVIAYATVETVN